MNNLVMLATATTQPTDNSIGSALTVLAFFAVIAVGVISWFKSRQKEIANYESLVDYLCIQMKEKIIPFIIDKALEEQLNSDTYEGFKAQCIEDFSHKLFGYIAENLDEFNIPDNLKPFFNKETIKIVTEKVCDLPEVDEVIRKVYDEHWKKRIEEIAALEEEECEKNLEFNDDGSDKEMTPASVKDNIEIEIPEADTSSLEEVIEEKEEESVNAAIDAEDTVILIVEDEKEN